ncbi:MAG: bifunctional phosphoribosylaminoimidazolecarboxamide formyltransferase/inosine monophosphate cyclohydrolase [Chloroflexota bacterium]
MRAILAPYDKTGLASFAQGLAELGWELFSTGNTFRVLSAAGVPVRPVQDLTGFPEILDGRVKTLHPGVHAGLLARRDRPEHLAELTAHGLAAIDLVVGGLYPFVETVAGGADLMAALEQIDIGGPAMIRAAAKNFPWVLVVVDPADYHEVLAALRAGAVSIELRRRLAAKAFQHVAAYDTAVAAYLRGEEPFPPVVTYAFQKLADLRYGENPHQRGAVYRGLDITPGAADGVATAELLHGLAMSFVNYVDADGAWEAVWDFEEPTCVIVKHATPCGLASDVDIVTAYTLALAADPVSAYGGIVAFNRPVDERLATAVREVRNPLSGLRQRYDVLIAPDYTPEGLRILKGKSKDLRLLRARPPRKGGQRIRQISGGLLVHDDDTFQSGEFQFRTVTQRAPSEEELVALRFAWRACKHVKSNAIVLARGTAVVGVGTGQPNRVTSVLLAARQAGERARGSVLASDAFFPFADGVEAAAAAGVTAIVQPGGSVRDDEVIAAADHAGIAMVFTGVRHFRH